MKALKFIIGFLVFASAILFALQFRAVSDKVAGLFKINADKFAYWVTSAYSVVGGLLLISLGVPLMGFPIIGGLLIATGVARTGFSIYKIINDQKKGTMSISSVQKVA